LERVTDLIEGFETPYGMELLSSVHWVAKREDPAARLHATAAAAAVARWSDRKKQLIQTSHIESAWQRLKDRDWI